MCVCMRVGVCVFEHVCMCVCVCLCVYLYRKEVFHQSFL